MTDERSRRFDQDLSSVLRQLAGEGAPASLRDRLADVTVTPPFERRSWFAAPVRWAVAAVAVVALAALAFLMVPRENVGPVPTSSAQPTASPVPSGAASPSAGASPTVTPSASPSATAAPTTIAWSSLTWSEAVAPAEGQFVRDIVRWGGRYAGVGGIETGSGVDAGFFTSSDGIHWTLAMRQPTTEHNVWVEYVVPVGNRLLAVGQVVVSAPGEKPAFAPPMWTSDDGLAWTQVHSPSWDAAFSGAWPGRLISGPRGAVAVSLGADPVVLASRDGSTWTRATLPVQERAVAEDAVAYAGGFAIVGRDGQPDQFSQAAINSQPPPGVGRPSAWISGDGVQWSQAAVEGNRVAGAGLGRVVAVGGGLLAVGVGSTADFYASVPTSWTSSDGGSWSIATALELPARPGGYPTVAAAGDRAVVFGSAPEGSTLAAWVLSEGAWVRLSFAGSAPVIDCGASESCVRVQRAWVVPGGVIVLGTPGSVAPESFWFAAAS
jgi:hypothetical protein